MHLGEEEAKELLPLTKQNRIDIVSLSMKLK